MNLMKRFKMLHSYKGMRYICNQLIMLISADHGLSQGKQGDAEKEITVNKMVN